MSKIKKLFKRIFPMTASSMQKEINKLHAAIGEIVATQTQLAQALENVHNMTRLLEQTMAAAKKSETHAAETVWAAVFHDTICDSNWLHNKTFSPGRWAVGYPFLYALYHILSKMQPSNILELGLGQSTRMISQFAENSEARHFVVENDSEWINFFKKDFNLSGKTEVVQLNYKMVSYKDAAEVRVYSDFVETLSEYGKYDFIMIDAPLGGDMIHYSRIDVLGLLPQCLSDTFVIMIDDVERLGEHNTIKEITSILSDSNREYAVGYYGGDKRCAVIASANMKFLCSL